VLSYCRERKKMVALTGIERVNFQFSSVRLSLSECKHVQFVRRGLLQTRHGGLACQRGASAQAEIGPEIVARLMSG
jgi:hypothetical protein